MKSENSKNMRIILPLDLYAKLVEQLKNTKKNSKNWNLICQTNKLKQ